VSATADYSMLAHLKCAYDTEHRPLDVTVLDRCETPLLLNRWYADRYGVRLTTQCSDALSYDGNNPYDLICTHSFFGRVDPDSRRRLIGRWHRLLRSGGVVVTTQRVHPGGRNRSRDDTEAEADDLRRRVMAAARGHPELGLDPDELGQAAYDDAIRRVRYVIRAVSEITDLFTAEGFHIELADQGGGPAERERDRPLSNVGRDSYRMRLIARKR
jgi:hypothetical protein